jgi:hypothetical protein
MAETIEFDLIQYTTVTSEKYLKSITRFSIPKTNLNYMMVDLMAHITKDNFKINWKDDLISIEALKFLQEKKIIHCRCANTKLSSLRSQYKNIVDEINIAVPSYKIQLLDDIPENYIISGDKCIEVALNNTSVRAFDTLLSYLVSKSYS